ncbi:MAG: hypothetical protein P4K80_10005 [Acidobacteriaceae bacterium]|nr:hypothetical protein [Acidobacteriaceae bacterium]
MSTGLNSGKLPSRPSHQAIEKASEDSINDFKSEQQKMDNVAMRGAKRAQNRIIANDQNIPGSTIFSK